MLLEEKELYEFGRFRLDVKERNLYRSDGVQNGTLPDKAFNTLVLLVRNPGRLISKQELLGEIWPDSFVEENNLDKCVHAIRHVFEEKPGDDEYIKTIRKRGYRFVADVKRIDNSAKPLPTDGIAESVATVLASAQPMAESSEPIRDGPASAQKSKSRSYRRFAFVAIGLTALLAVFIFSPVSSTLRNSVFGKDEPAQIRSLAVLPLRSLNPEADDEYLGLGIADTIIAKISRVGGVTVRPTSSVRKFVGQETDSLEAGQRLQVEAVLDGTFLRVGDRLRVSVNLLRVENGESLWTESFDLPFTDIFAMQDEVSKAVAERLVYRLAPAQQERLTKRYTTNPEAYSYYTKAMYHFSNRGFSGSPQEETETAIDLFKKAIELDPNNAVAHAKLGYAYAWLADFKEAGPDLIAKAKEELRIAELLDPQLAEVHIARSFIAWSHFEGWQIEEAIREGRLAKRMNPDSGDQLLASLYYHIGFEQQAAMEFESALERDPTSDTVKNSYLSMYSNLAKPDEWFALNQRLFNSGPDSRYYLEKRMLAEAEPLIDEEYARDSDEPYMLRNRALLLALQGKHREAQAGVPRIMELARKDKGYHHYPYDIARVYALDSKSKEAVKWLRLAVKDGFPCYPLFARDPFLDPVRNDPAFILFMNEMKIRWAGYKREFGTA